MNQSINWLNYCEPCGSSCCYGETVFASATERVRLGIEQSEIAQKIDGSCVFLSESGSCRVYDRRPLECQIFPFDLWIEDQVPLWLLWDTCPASQPLFTLEQALEAVHQLEQRFFYTGQYDLDYVRAYHAHHDRPGKYDDDHVDDTDYRVIRPVCFSRSEYQQLCGYVLQG